MELNRLKHGTEAHTSENAICSQSQSTQGWNFKTHMELQKHKEHQDGTLGTLETQKFELWKGKEDKNFRTEVFNETELRTASSAVCSRSKHEIEQTVFELSKNYVVMKS